MEDDEDLTDERKGYTVKQMIKALKGEQIDCSCYINQ
jgi:hypothetical protein